VRFHLAQDGKAPDGEARLWFEAHLLFKTYTVGMGSLNLI
jgi:hypothetical protein